MILRFAYVFICLSLLSHSAHADNHKQAAVASAHPLATQAGIEILQQGGNAFDAAIAVSAALAVVEPTGSGLGGGGFWLLHRESDQFQIMIDGREKAPSAAHRDMYLDKNGKANPKASLNGPFSAGIPGLPAALVHLSQHYGKLSLAQTLAPAIRYAEQGFSVTEHYQKLLGFRRDVMASYPDSNAIFLRNSQIPKIGTRIIQTDLANTLRKIAQHGKAGFYQGNVANKLVDSVRHNGGIWSLEDLKNYQVVERKPITGTYKNYTITSASLPSSGGITLVSMLNQLELLPLTDTTKFQRRHFIVEAMRRAYHDRNYYLGDSDFVSPPVEKLTSKSYAAELVKTINPDLATSNDELDKAPRAKGEDTTHFSVIDQNGNRVSATLSINYPFGSGFVAKGTGVLLNDEMDDFSSQVGQENVYKLVGSQANEIAPNKRPLSSMSPTFIEDNQHLMIIGTPGGSRIITMVLLGMLDFIDGDNAQEIVAAPRFHHQHLPNYIQIESVGFSPDEIKEFEQHGHKTKLLSRQYGNMQVVIKDKNSGVVTAASDPRGEGESIVEVIKH